ncbi:MAG TPA: N-acetyl-D-Glu racemase DgcA [Xanthobacteraceae bacterium]|nr:N-acetyl-D-Glu racemase DgcA [Xanthobacteraceae bacterium]
MSLALTVRTERWPVAGVFTIARGSRSEAVVVVVELSDGHATGRGECVPYRRYGETVTSVTAAIEGQRGALAGGLDQARLQDAMATGAARNALDCAFWDLAAKRAGRPVHALAGLPPPRPLTTAFTISLGTPAAMAEAAAKASARALLKIKLGGDGDPERLAAVRRAAPRAELIVDANESWSARNLADNMAACAAAGVTLVEQPLPQSADDPLADIAHPIAICADESAHDRSSLDRLAGKYDAINIKLDKAGGLTEALLLAAEAERRGFALMVGCMVATSLSMAPAVLVAQKARVVDLDGPLILARDRPHGLLYEQSLVHPATAELWG